jgi:hypothetical protein
MRHIFRNATSQITFKNVARCTGPMGLGPLRTSLYRPGCSTVAVRSRAGWTLTLAAIFSSVSRSSSFRSTKHPPVRFKIFVAESGERWAPRAGASGSTLRRVRHPAPKPLLSPRSAWIPFARGELRLRRCNSAPRINPRPAERGSAIGGAGPVHRSFRRERDDGVDLRVDTLDLR